ncbi:hypothetical protein V6N13_029806 [Hibiscus sabdariffa]
MTLPTSSGVRCVQLQGLRKKRCCSIPGRKMSNAMLQHWCTRRQTEENDKGMHLSQLTRGLLSQLSLHVGGLTW